MPIEAGAIAADTLRRKLIVAFALWLGLWLAPAAAMAAPRIGVMTMEPGEAFWERFGHDAIVVVDPDTGQAESYNFGFFDLDEDGFIGRFIAGRMQYRLVVLPLDYDLAGYAEAGRGVGIQWLDLDAAQAETLVAALRENARPENSRYTYDYYTANCATRVRDALDAALGGAIKAQLSSRSQGNTYRSESVRLAWPAKWMATGFDLGLGAYADRPLSRWDEAFIPMRLRDSLREIRRADGRPLVQSEAQLLPHRLSRPPEELPRVRLAALLSGMGLAIAILAIARRRPRLLAAAALVFWMLCGLTGAVMLFVWLGSAHVAGHGNLNLLLLSPLAWLALPGAWALLRGREPSRFFRRLLLVLAGCAALAAFLKLLPFVPQDNLNWLLLLLPVHWALARSLGPPKTVATPAL